MFHQNNIPKGDYSIVKSPIVISPESKILAWVALRDDSATKQLQQLDTEGFEWESLYALAKRHRMVPLLYHAIEKKWIGQPPAPILNEISDETRVHWLQAANRSYDQRRLLSSFERENISAIILKGTPLSYRLYGNFAIRHSKDIDLLIHPSDRKKATTLLYKQGFRPLDLHRSNAGEWYLENVENKLELIHPVKGTNLELMWRLHQQTEDPPIELFYTDAEKKTTPIYNLTPFDEAKDLLAHGAKHGWERLKWLTDLWRVWECYEVNWQDWIVEIHKDGLEPALQSALILHKWIIPAHPLPDDLIIKNRIIKPAKILSNWAIREIAGNAYRPDLENRNLVQNLRASGVKYISLRPAFNLQKLRFGLINRKDVEALSLPQWAFSLYPFFKPLTWLIRIFKTLRNPKQINQKKVTIEEELSEEKELRGGNYRLFGMKVSSEIALPLERMNSNKTTDVSISVTDFLTDEENVNEWSINIPATGSILLKDNHTILMNPAPAVSPAKLRLWLLGSTLGALCWRRGWIPLHATSVRFKDRVVMISGPSGVGKSTLAAACLANGAELYTDDITPLFLNDSGEPVIPGSGLRRLKLWPDAADRFQTQAKCVGVVEKGMEKLEFRPDYIQDKPEIAKVLICLEDDPEVKKFGLLRGSESLRAISENLFYIGLMPETMKGSVMKNIAKLSKKITVIRIKRPAGLDDVEILAKKLESGWPGDEDI